jgi:hypothetical protein
MPYDVVAEGATLFDPESGSDPLQPPLAVHDVALFDDHVRVEELPAVIEVGLGTIDAVGGGMTALTDTVTDLATEPPLVPVQVKA